LVCPLVVLLCSRVSSGEGRAWCVMGWWTTGVAGRCCSRHGVMLPTRGGVGQRKQLGVGPRVMVRCAAEGAKGSAPVSNPWARTAARCAGLWAWMPAVISPSRGAGVIWSGIPTIRCAGVMLPQGRHGLHRAARGGGSRGRPRSGSAHPNDCHELEEGCLAAWELVRYRMGLLQREFDTRTTHTSPDGTIGVRMCGRS
jgi:hypothetical protein